VFSHPEYRGSEIFREIGPRDVPPRAARFFREIN
jgi:hypothetical protein